MVETLLSLQRPRVRSLVRERRSRALLRMTKRTGKKKKENKIFWEQTGYSEVKIWR